MGFLYFLFAGGFVTLFIGLAEATTGVNGESDASFPTLLKFVGILAMVVAGLAMAALSSRRRQKERKRGQLELRRQGSSLHH